MAKATMFCVYIPEDFSTTDFWDNSNGREIADRYGLKQIGTMYWLSLENGASLLMELNRNEHCKVWNESFRRYDYNIVCFPTD